MSFEWPVDRTSFPALPTLSGSPTADEQAAYDKALAEQRAAAQLAVTVLWALSGRQFGLSEHTVRPCRPAYGPAVHGHYGGGVTSYLLSWEGDRWINWTCGCVGGCTQTGPRMVHLPGPVHSITEVKIADAVVPADGYVLSGDVLYRKGGPWPRQDLGRPPGEANTWTVRYQRGIEVPYAAEQLTGILASEFLKALSADPTRCRLPRTVTTASRNGVTYRAYDPAVIYANGKTGLPEVDLWLASVNPNHLAAAPTVI